MGKGWGFILLIVGLALIYLAATSIEPFTTSLNGINYYLIFGIILAIVGLFNFIFPRRPKQPRY
jgi:uncharacterized membrane protein